MTDAGQSVSQGRSPDSSPPPRGDAPLHWTLLWLSAGVLLLALVLETRGEETVVVPVLNLPLPGTCSYKRLVGKECPGCGLTRCFISAAHGDWARAWKFNPAGIYFFAVVLCQLPYRAWQLWRMHRGQDELDGGRLTMFVLGILIAGLLVQWVVRLAVPLDM